MFRELVKEKWEAIVNECKRMPKAQAHGAIQIFEAIGYFDMI